MGCFIEWWILQNHSMFSFFKKKSAPSRRPRLLTRLRSRCARHRRQPLRQPRLQPRLPRLRR